MDAGKLNKRLKVLTYTAGQWQETGTVWAKAEYKDKVVFSQYAKGQPGANFVIRRSSAFTRGNALQMGAQHYLVAALDTFDSMYWDVIAAAVTPVSCVRIREVSNGLGENNKPITGQESGAPFFGVLSPEYVGFSAGRPNVSLTQTCVLTTPKAVQLESGDLLETGGKTYEVQECHTMDKWQNDYILAWVGDA